MPKSKFMTPCLISAGAVLSAIGHPETRDMIGQHRYLRSQLNQRQGVLDKLNAILKDLQVKYTQYKHQIFFKRYRSMKRMIKSAVEQVGQVLDDTQNQSTQSEVEGQGSAENLGLVENARIFCENARSLAEQEKYYSELSAKQLDEVLRNLQAQIQQLDEEISKKSKLLEQLEEDYQNAKNLLYHKRYRALKKMIKDTFSDSR